MSERMTAWQCIGCGRIEGPQPCVGICQDRKVAFVYAADHDEALIELARVRRQADALAALVRQLAATTPRAGEWERTYRVLQARARATLDMRAAGKGGDHDASSASPGANSRARKALATNRLASTSQNAWISPKAADSADHPSRPMKTSRRRP